MPARPEANTPINANTTGRFLSIEQVAAELNITNSQAYALLRSGSLPALKISGRGQWRVERTRLEEWIETTYSQTGTYVEEHPIEPVTPGATTSVTRPAQTTTTTTTKRTPAVAGPLVRPRASAGLMARRYRLVDWTAEAGLEEDWLAPWADDGWVPEHADGGSWCVVNGHQMKRRFLTRLEDAATSHRIP